MHGYLLDCSKHLVITSNPEVNVSTGVVQESVTDYISNVL